MKKTIATIAAVADMIPGVIIIHELPEFTLRYMSKKGLELLGAKWSEISGLSNHEYHTRFFNKDDSDNYVPRILDLLARNAADTVSYFQQVRTSRKNDWDWYMSMTKILLRDDSNKPLLIITTAMQVDPEHYFTAKAVRLLKENEFLRANYHNFAKITSREREILRMLALGRTSHEIAEEMSLSKATIETHRKNIKRKINIRTAYDLSLYARAFDLV